jgi:beta-lactamase superfamily II metal-dependent hydrolase
MTDFYKGKYNENTLSLALKVSYGDFDYFMGSDNTGLQGFGLPDWFNVETPMAKVVGKVEVATLNHHWNREATNDFFVKTLDPKVVIQQSWCSDHPGQEVYHRLIYKDTSLEGRDVFATNMHPETLITYGP